MADSELMLKTKIRILSVFTGKTSRQFWSSMDNGDLIEITTTVESIGKYAQTFNLENLSQRRRYSMNGGELAAILRKTIWEYES